MRAVPGAAGWLRLCGTLLALLLLALRLGAEATQGWSTLAAAPRWSPDEVVVAAAATTGAAVAVWLALGVLASTAQLVRRGPARRPPLVPATVVRATALVLGVTLTAAVVQPAASAASAAPDPGWRTTQHAAPQAAELPAQPAAAVTSAWDAAPDPGWRPTAPSSAPRVVAEPIDPVLLSGVRRPSHERQLVTVRRGDTLWDLAARGLGAGATDAEIAAEWPRWYAANRAVVGADPDLLLPGQQLVPPDG